MTNTKTRPCKKCENRYRKLTSEGLCFFCAIKSGKHPKEFSGTKEEKYQFKKK